MVTYANKLMQHGKALFLAYDQGLEHGPRDFNWTNARPEHIIHIAQEGQFNGVIFQKGNAEQYNREVRKAEVPLIVKLNGKTTLCDGEPISQQLCDVEDAVELGAAAVGYTVYIGSQHEHTMLSEFADIQWEAHEHDLPVIAWIYPRGASVESVGAPQLMAYAARVGLEIGADIAKIKLAGTQADLEWAVQCAGKTHIVISGGTKTAEAELLEDVDTVMAAGASGLAIGRNIWQRDNPVAMAKQVRERVFG